MTDDSSLAYVLDAGYPLIPVPGVWSIRVLAIGSGLANASVLVGLDGAERLGKRDKQSVLSLEGNPNPRQRFPPLPVQNRPVVALYRALPRRHPKMTIMILPVSAEIKNTGVRVAEYWSLVKRCCVRKYRYMPVWDSSRWMH